MKKIFMFSLMMFVFTTLSYSQQSTAGVSVKYALTPLQGKKMANSNYDDYMMYATGRYQIYVNDATQKLAVKTITTGKEVLAWGKDEVNEYTKFDPHFFIPDYKNFPVILMLEEIIDGSSNGQHVILMDKGMAYYCGFINLAADKGEGASITKYAQISMKAGVLTISFTNESSLFSWENYEIYKGKDISFEIDTQNVKNGLKPTEGSLYKIIGGAGNYPAPEEKLNTTTEQKQPQKEEFSW
jgi:hypothetical protein